ncbi:hypothetical protein W97_03148 [Coniosporium apollinis CBS 100218]|uniref:COP9 signalosome complex subunit 3 n=1 Tax=Coniosporium apollinis (strain CBS 100218) TaxID=1168221 RepID=R7YPR8_CONA1|nr:uncharacterized protein W97_03148 [Coniosporium apollinis CBS 100218]EON63920.1 hypothetical protein W97_03148 [Coniosporium apollinis CBS 100218]
MADVASALLSFPPDAQALSSLQHVEYDRQIRSYINVLQSIPLATLAKAAGIQNDLLELLDPSINSLAYIYVLTAQIHASSVKSTKIPDAHRPDGPFWLKLSDFLVTCDPIQMRYAGELWRRLLEYIERITRFFRAPLAGIPLICAALLRLDPMTGTLTSNHLNYIRLCLEARMYRHALPILDNPISGFPTAPVSGATNAVPCADHSVSSAWITSRSGHSDKIEISHVQEYFLLGAMIYLGLEKYPQARLFLEHVLTSPAQGVASGMMVEAYRKWLLVGCLIEGKTPESPRTVNSSALKVLRSTSKPYETVVEIFQNRDMPRLQADVDAGAELWRNDGNLGLIRTLLRALPRFYILNLSKTYAAIPLPSVARLLNLTPSDAHAYIESLIASGHLNGRIDYPIAPDAPAVLRFFDAGAPDGPLARNESQQLAALVAQMARTNELAEMVKAADLRLRLTREYVEYNRRRKGKKGGVGGGGDVGGDAEMADPGLADVDVGDIGDEDLMGDLH